MSSIEQKEESKGNSGQVEKIKAYRQKVEKELSEVCNDILAVLDQHLIPNAQVGFAGSGFGRVRGGGAGCGVGERGGRGWVQLADLSFFFFPPDSYSMERARCFTTRCTFGPNFAFLPSEDVSHP